LSRSKQKKKDEKYFSANLQKSLLQRLPGSQPLQRGPSRASKSSKNRSYASKSADARSSAYNLKQFQVSKSIPSRDSSLESSVGEESISKPIQIQDSSLKSVLDRISKLTDESPNDKSGGYENPKSVVATKEQSPQTVKVRPFL
jgi:hypothetical protein